MKKKIMAAVLSALMLGGAVAVSAADSGDDTIVLNADNEYKLDLVIHLIGDINGDGSFTASDYGKILRAAKGTGNLTDYEFAVADIDGNGSITASDYGKVLRQVKGTGSLFG